MRRTLIALSGMAALGLGTVIGAYAWIETGEVVVVHVRDDAGTIHGTRLWVVDQGGAPWIGSTDPLYTSWFPRLQAHPRVELEREGVRSCRRAVVERDEAVRREIRRVYVEKYRLQLVGSNLLKWMGGARRDTAQWVAIRLDPCEPKAAE